MAQRVACVIAGRIVPSNQRAWLKSLLHRISGGISWSLVVDSLDVDADCILVAGPSPWLSPAWDWATDPSAAHRPFGIWLDHPASLSKINPNEGWIDIRIGFERVERHTLWVPNWLRLMEHRLTDPQMAAMRGLQVGQMRFGLTAAGKSISSTKLYAQEERGLVEALSALCPAEIPPEEEDEEDDDVIQNVAENDPYDNGVGAREAEAKKRASELDHIYIAEDRIRDVLERSWYGNLPNEAAWTACRLLWTAHINRRDEEMRERQSQLLQRMGLEVPTDSPPPTIALSPEQILESLKFTDPDFASSTRLLSSAIAALTECEGYPMLSDPASLPFSVINLDRRPERWTVLRRLLRSWGSQSCWPLLDIRRMSAVDAHRSLRDAGLPIPFPFNKPTKSLVYGAVGCWLSHVQIWRRIAVGRAHPSEDAVESKDQAEPDLERQDVHSGLECIPLDLCGLIVEYARKSSWYGIFEDDIVPAATFYQRMKGLSALMTKVELDKSWDIIWLGTHLLPEARCRAFSMTGQLPFFRRLTREETVIGGTFAYLISRKGAKYLLAAYDKAKLIDVGIDGWMMKHSGARQLCIHPPIVFSHYFLPHDSSTHQSDCAE
jgi:GR25 family glycosyltransferase involved in LPS biosynthesis